MGTSTLGATGRLRTRNHVRGGGLRAGFVLVGGVLAFAQQPGAPVQQAAAPVPVETRVAAIDVVVLDSSNRPLTTLSTGDLRVTLDGEARAVTGMQYVVKGRGAVTAARSLSPTMRLPITAQPSRVVVLAIDEDSVTRGSEKPLSEAVGRMIDNLATADQVLVVSLPTMPDRMSASADRGTLRDGLARVVGRARPETVMAQPLAAPPPDPTTPPDDEEAILRNRGTEARIQQLGGQQRDMQDAAGGAQVGPTSPSAIARLFDGMRDLPGQKIVVVFSGGEHTAASGSPADDMVGQAQFVSTTEAAVAARAVVHAVHVPRAGSRQRDKDLERLAAATGGRSVSVSGGARDLDPIDGAMAGSYLLQVERRPDDDRRTRALRVTTTRRGATVVAATRWAARVDPLPEPLPDEAPPPSAATAAVPVPAPSPMPARGRSRPAPRNDPELNAVLARVSEYLAGYIREFSNVVAEEVYLQHINLDRPNAKLEMRRLRSDLLIVQLGGTVGWIPFRDVFEVDGTPVRDRQERLQKLFLEGTEDALKQATRISNESARHNLGMIRRTVNIPTLALEYILPNAIARCNFVRRGEENVQGVRAWKVDFEEWGSPTVIKTGQSFNEDYPVTGSLWVEPLTGRIVKTRVRASDGQVSMESTVLFARNDALGIWTPAEMKEVYEQRSGKIGGDAKYINFRRFQVTTEEAIKVPK